MTALHRFSSHFLRTALFLLISAIIFFAALIPSFADTSEASDSGLEVKISLNKKSYTEGENVIISLSLTNNTGKTLENISVRHFIPDCFDFTDSTLINIARLTPRQTESRYIYAIANKNVEYLDPVSAEPESDSGYIYIIIAVSVAVVFAAVTVTMLIREKSRKKVAGTISFVIALIFSFSLAVIPSIGIFAASEEPIYTEDITYEDAVSIINRIMPEKASEITDYLSPKAPLTREKAALISALMISGKAQLPEGSEKSFLDLPSEALSKPYVELCISQKIMSEISPGTFLPNEEMNGYEFLECLLRAIGFGANGEYDGNSKLAFVAADALNLPHADLSALLKEDTLTCSEALCHAVKLMTGNSAKVLENSSYDISSASLISYFEGVTENKAIATNGEAFCISESGEKIKLSKNDPDQRSYIITYFEGSPIAVTPDIFTAEKNYILLKANGETVYLGATVEYSRHAMKEDYSALSGILNTSSEIFTAGNTHYIANSSAFNETIYIIDSDTANKDDIDFKKPIVLIASFDSRSLTYSINSIAYAYQLSTTETADYADYNTSLSLAKEISNAQKTYLQSAYEAFLNKISEIDAHLKKDLVDTEDNRKAIAISQSAIEEAVKVLEKNRIASYTALDEQINLAIELISSEGDYTEESFALLMEAYKNATEVSRELLDSEKNNTLIESLKTSLSNAINSLEMSQYCNYTEYYAALDRAKAITNTLGKYTASQFSSFKKKISSIDNGLNKKLTRSEKNQQTIDKACESLLKAISDLNYNIPCDYSQLDAAIEIALTYDNSDFAWTNASFTALQEALTAAKKVERNMKAGYGTTNQDTINAAATYLTASISNLKKNKLCDYSAYNAALKAANALENTDGLYDEAIFKLFKETLAEIDAGLPKNLYNADATNEIIAKAISDIAKATELLEDPVECDYTELDNALKLAEDTKNSGNEYTAESLKALNDAIDAAQNIERGLLSDALGKRQAAIDKAAEEINAAITALIIQETFSAEILSVDEKTVTVNNEKVVQTFITIKHDDKEEELLLPEGIVEIIPNVGDKVTVSVADGTVTALVILPSAPEESDPELA